MQVIAVASRKGGSGKTTLSGHLAVAAEQAGRAPVALVDIDPQGSLSDWWNAREADSPLFVQTNVERLAEDVRRLEDMGIDLLVIDTPPALTALMADVIAVSDLIVIPTRPSPHDLRSLGRTVELVEHLGKPLLFVINGAAPRARITDEAVSVLSRHGPLAPTVIHQRVDFASSMIDGRTVMELPGRSKSAAEVAELWDFIDSRLTGRVFRRALPSAPARPAAPDLFGPTDDAAVSTYA